MNIKEMKKKFLRDIVYVSPELDQNKGEGFYVCVDSRWTIDHGWETISLLCDKDGNINWREELGTEISTSYYHMLICHHEVVRGWKERGDGFFESF